MIARSLGPSVVKLSLDPNGNHVVQRALQHMPAPRNDFVLEAITGSLVQVFIAWRLIGGSVETDPIFSAVAVAMTVAVGVDLSACLC